MISENMYICSICCKEIHESEKDEKVQNYPNLIHCMGCFRTFHGYCCFNVHEYNTLPIPMKNEQNFTNEIEFELTFVCQFCKFFHDAELTVTGEKFMKNKQVLFTRIIETLAEWVS